MNILPNKAAFKTKLAEFLLRFLDMSPEMGLLDMRMEEPHTGKKGEVFFEVRDELTGAILDSRHINNVITLDMSVLLARMLKDSLEPSHGVYALAMGTGDVGWDLQNPPVATDEQRSLFAEIGRKTFVSVDFVDAGGLVSAVPTNVLDFTTTFTGSEVVGPLVEMGLLGGDISDNLAVTAPVTPPSGVYDATQDTRNLDSLCNYLTFPVINKPASATMTIVWRITL